MATHGVIPREEAEQMALEQGIDVPELMMQLVPKAAKFALPSISNFYVGAVAQGTSTGSLYFGANMEFVGGALSFTTHAEQSASTNAWINGEEGLSSIAVSAAPCGYCRQFLYELTTADKLEVMLENQPTKELTSFLPDPFGPKDLQVTAALMSPQSHGLTLVDGDGDPSVQAALAAADASYAPYTASYAGVAVTTATGAVFAGRLAENAAFNPSMSPLESALNMWNFGKTGSDPVQRVTLVQVEGAVADQTSATLALVDSLRREGPVEFDQHAARKPTSAS
ncbi:MAG TPA: cytidine deaminase [Solirubrobacterales bacterium]|nr:cytidine deaminase [Solirubrobacterales bacterium]